MNCQGCKDLEGCGSCERLIAASDDVRAESLRELYRQHVKHPTGDGHWKGPAEACVPVLIAGYVAEAMNFMGSTVDERWTKDGMTTLRSAGYWAHGF